MRAAKGPGECNGRLRHSDPVHVVRHQTVAHQGDTELGRRALHELKIDLAVSIGEEDGLAVDAALGEVMGDAWENGSGHAGHRQD